MNDYLSIVAVALFAILLLASLLYFQRVGPKKESDPHAVIASMTLDAVFIAIIMIMTFVPYLGYIAVTPFVSLTLLHIPVLLGAAIGGWKKGLVLGLVFGLSSYMQALSSAGFNALFAYPWVAIPPRMLFGLAAGIVFTLLRKVSKTKAYGIYLALACAGLTFLHTALVFGDLFVFYPDTIIGLFSSTSPVAATTALTFTLIILLGCLGEMALAAIIVPSLHLIAGKVLHHNRKPRRL